MTQQASSRTGEKCRDALAGLPLGAITGIT
jgi:hypothetical protein